MQKFQNQLNASNECIQPMHTNSVVCINYMNEVIIIIIRSTPTAGVKVEV